MSIIHDALKKVQASLQKASSSPAAQQTPAQTSAPAVPPVEQRTSPDGPPEEKLEVLRKPRTGQLLWIFGILLVLCWLTYRSSLEGFDFGTVKKWVDAQQLRIKTMVAGKKPAQPLAVVVPSPASSADSGKPSSVFNIQGVMTSGDKNVALINGKIYEEGNEIGGIKILSIEHNTIQISNNGKTETIQIGY